jgi:glycerophosphoryl diester phosphodiesterase
MKWCLKNFQGMRCMAGLLALALYTNAALAAEGFLKNGVTAHRGNSGEHPENTLPAFRSAIDLGADWIELDIFLTRDGKLVLSHDRTTGRMGDRSLVVPDSTYEELRTVDVAASFRQARGKTIRECPKHTMPLLEEVIALVMTQERTRVSIQPKMDCVAEAVALVRKMRAEKWAGFNDGNLQYVAKVKELAPEIVVFWDRNRTNITQDLKIAQQHGFEGFVLERALVTPERVREIQAAGLEAGAWTVNDEAQMKRFLAYGIDRIYTDHPRRLLEIKRQRSGPDPRETRSRP